MEEKRKNKRTDLDINVSLGIITEDVNKEKEYIDVEITDVSKMGLGFKTDKQLLVGDCFDARIQIWTKEIIDAVLKGISLWMYLCGHDRYRCSEDSNISDVQ